MRMLIGELSKRSGLSRDTIRFYEKEGLIALNKKQRRTNNYKEYSEQTLDRLLQIQRIKGFGFTLTETASLLDMIYAHEASCNHVSEVIGQKVALIDKKIEELQQLRQLLTSSVEQCEACCAPVEETENCPIFELDGFVQK